MTMDPQLVSTNVTLNDWTIPLVAVAGVILVSVWLSGHKSRPQAKMPPGPKGFPFLGYLPFLGDNPHIKLRDLSREYGHIVGFKVGVRNIVVLNDYDSIKEALHKKDLLWKAEGLTRSPKVGLVTPNGKTWLDNRKFTVQALRDLGLGKKSGEERIAEQVLKLVQDIGKTAGAPVKFRNHVWPSVANNIGSMLFGTVFGPDDPRRTTLNFLLRTGLDALAQGPNFSVLPPLLDRALAMLPFTRAGRIKRIISQLRAFCSLQIDDHETHFSESSVCDFIDEYFLKMKAQEHDPTSSFTKHHLLHSVLDLIAGGSNPVMVNIYWHMLNFAKHPDTLQVEVQKEIDLVVGRDRQPSWDDRHRMPLTMSVLWEMHRWRLILPLGTPRLAICDTDVKGITIPEGTAVFTNFWAVHTDPRLWKDPEVFDSKRFLVNGRDATLTAPEHLLQFSLGKRNCPGELLANTQIFLYVTSLLQKFRVLPDHGEDISLDPETVFILMPKEQKLRFVQR